MGKGLLLFLLLLGLSSCSDGWKKDAFEDESESVKNAVPFNERKKKIPPPDKDVIFMNFEPVYSVQEEDTLNIPIKYTIGHPEVKFQEIVVQSANDFPGLVYEREAGIISITPPAETVDISSNGYKLQVLEISLFAEYQGVILESIAKINIMIVPKLVGRGVLPQVLKVVGFPEGASPGERHEFKVYVHGSTEQPPRLQVYSSDGANKYINVTNSTNPTNGFKDHEILKNCDCYDNTTENGLDIWEFEANLTLPEGIKLSIMNVYNRYDAGFVAYSIYGIPSATFPKQFLVSLKEAPEPEFVGEAVVNFSKGGWNSHTFLVIDRSRLSKVSASCISPQGSTCPCQQRDDSQSSCTLRWKPGETGEFEVKVHKTGRIFGEGENGELIHETSVDESFRVHVVDDNDDAAKTPVCPKELDDMGMGRVNFQPLPYKTGSPDGKPGGDNPSGVTETSAAGGESGGSVGPPVHTPNEPVDTGTVVEPMIQ